MPFLPAPMSRKDRRLARVLADRLLAGVGDSMQRVDPSERVIHLRRPLTSAEERLLPPGWDELEAIDEAGTGGFLDSIAERRRR